MSNKVFVHQSSLKIKEHIYITYITVINTTKTRITKLVHTDILLYSNPDAYGAVRQSYKTFIPLVFKQSWVAGRQVSDPSNIGSLMTNILLCSKSY